MQAQYFLPCVWPQRNAIGAGCRLQGRERAIGLGLGQVAHAVRVSTLTMRWMIRLSSISSSAVLGARFMEQRLARIAAIHAIEDQAMQMN